MVDLAGPPPKRRIYLLDNNKLEELKAQLKLFIETNRIRQSNSPYGAPILLAKRKSGSLRMYIYILSSFKSIDSSG